MNYYGNKSLGKALLFLIVILLGIGSLIYTRYLVSKLKEEERKKVETWAEATRLINSADSSQNVDFLFTIIENNNTVPVILTDGHDNILAYRNFNPSRVNDPGYIALNLEKIRREKEPIIIDLPDGLVNKIYYKDSIILTQLMYYPYVQIGVIVLFILISFLALSSSRRAEQNQLWVAMSKETAHQLGTPTSSLAAWIDILQNMHPEVAISKELALDIERLEKVTERFSRIGSKPSLARENIVKLILNSVEYLKTRSSSRVQFNLEFDESREVVLPVNSALFEWVIENVSKNAIDAMEGVGTVTMRISETEKQVMLDISDTGKGIPKALFRKIFSPGFTTKERGWGLGLSLAKRIIEKYHKGKIFVKSSEIGKGSCIRIILNKTK